MNDTQRTSGRHQPRTIDRYSDRVEVTTMRRTLIGLAAVTLVLVGASGARQRNQAEIDLQAAIRIETVSGDLAGAIKRYQSIVEKYKKTNRTVAADALIHLADGYRKAGDTQARAVYERIVREFADVAAAAVAATARLADLGAAPRRGAASALAMRKLYDGPGLDWCNGLSSDLRYLSHPDWRTGNIAVADLQTGTVRPVTTDGGISLVTAQAGEFGECTVFSPDDRQIGFYWNGKNKAQQLRLIGVDGSRLRVLYQDAEASYLQPLDWFRDGRILTLRSLKDRTRQIVTVSAIDGTLQRLKTLDNGDPEIAASFSPDGRAIAYSARGSTDSLKRDVYVTAGDGSRTAVVVRHPADDFLLGWAPDGRTVFFASDRTGTYGVWKVEVENGQAIGNPILAKADIGLITPIRLVKGTLYYRVSSQLSDVYLASMDPESGQVLSAPVRAKPDFAGSIAKPSWSPDGASLAYLSFGGTTGYPASPQSVSILNVATGVERRVRPAVEALEPYGTGPVWSPDGRSLLIIARQQTPQHGLYRVDVETGATTKVVSAVGQYLLNAVWSRDGRNVFYTIGGPTRIVRHDLTAQADVEVVSLSNPAGVPKISLSPDGQTLAFTSRKQDPGAKPIAILSVVPAFGGAAREIYRAGENEATGFVAWAPDGRYVFFGKSVADTTTAAGSARRELWRVAPDGRQLQKTDLGVRGFEGGFSFSPDGRRMAFTVAESKSELWALENLAPVRSPD